MALIQINGVDITTPTSYTVGIMDISKAQRNAAGTMFINRIATKRKLTLSWQFLYADELATILQLVSDVFFDVTYVDPQTNSIVTKTFYCGDRSVTAVDYINGVMRWRDVKFDLIEQ
jgi:hypothetical protein